MLSVQYDAQASQSCTPLDILTWDWTVYTIVTREELGIYI
jgi:hypothetical protein